MTDKLNIQMDSADAVTGAKQLTSALMELRTAVQALPQSPINSLRQDVGAIATAMTTLSMSFDKLFSGVVKSMEASMAGAARAAKVGGDQTVAAVRATRQELQREYERMAGMGTVKLGALANLKVQGISLFPADAERLAAANELRKMETAVTQRAAAVAKMSETGESARLANLARMQVGSLKVSEGLEKSAKAEESARLAWLARLQTGSLKVSEGLEKSADREYLARMAWVAKLQLGTLKMSEAQAKADASERLASLGRQAQVFVNQARAAPSGDYSVSEGVNRGATKVLAADVAAAAAAHKEVALAATKSTAAAGDLDKAQRALGASTRDLHSGVRGLASGFGAMWLTWGSILPLMAGAAVSSAFVQTIKMGAQVQDSLIKLRVLGSESAEAVGSLNTQMLELSRSGPFGPREVAEAMKTLTLAGLSAADVGKTIKDVLNFSVAGDVGVKESAEALTTIASAFGTSASGFGYVSDVISKMAAESKSSVGDMAEAMKTAAVVNKLYGVSLEDTAVGLALLANAGIKGTAAGTSLKNMYADLTGHTKKAREELERLNVQPLDKITGKMRDTSIIFKELVASLSSKNSAIGMTRTLSNIFGERSIKEVAQIIEAIKKQVSEGTASASSLIDDLVNKAQNAAGFASIAAAEIALTPMNQMKSVAATLQAALVETFESLQPYLLETALKLKEVFNSDGFKGGLQSLVVGIAEVTVWLVDHGKALATLAVGYVGLKAAATGVMGLHAAWMVLSPAVVAGVAQIGLAARLATMANPLLLALAAAVTAAASAWAAYALWSGKGADATQRNTDVDRKGLIAGLTAERDRLSDINEAYTKKISLEQLMQERKGKEVVRQGADAVSVAQRELDKVRESADKLGRPLVVAAQKKDELAALAKLQAAKGDLASSTLQAASLKQEIINEQALITIREKNAAAKRLESGATGKNDGAGPDKGRSPANTLKLTHSNELTQISARHSAEMSIINDAEAGKMKILQAQRSTQLIGQGTFYAQEIQLVHATEQAKLAEIEKATGLYQTQYTKQVQINRDELAKFEAEERARKPKKGDKSSVERLADASKVAGEALEKLSSEYDTFMEKQGAEKAKIENGAMVRLTLQTIAMRGELAKAQEAQREFFRAENEQVASRDRQSALEDQLRYASPQAQAYLSATAAETERLRNVELGHTKAIEGTQRQIDELNAAQAKSNTLTTDYIEANETLNEVLRGQIRLRDQVKGTVAESSEREGARALKKYEKDHVAELSRSTAEATVTGLTDGGASGAVKLREIIVAELRKPVVLLVQALISPIMGELTGSLGGGGGGGAGGLGKLFSGGSFNPLDSLLNSGSSLGGLFSSAGAYGSALGGGAATGVGSQAAMLAAQTGEFGLAGLGATAGAASGAGASMAALATAGEAAAFGVSSLAATTGTVATGMAGFSTALAAIPGWGWALGGLALLGGSGLFGGSKEQVDSTGISGRFGPGGFAGQNFSKWHRSGGLFETSSSGNNLSALDPAQAKGLSDSFLALRSQATDFAEALGLSSTGIANFTKDIELALGGDSAANERVIAGAMQTLGNDLAQQALGASTTTSRTVVEDLGGYSGGGYGDPGQWMSDYRERVITETTYAASEFARSGEGAFDTLKRLGGSLKAVNSVFDSLDLKLYAVSLAGGDMASKLVDAVGGLEAFATKTANYYDKFYSDEEKLANVRQAATLALAKVGLSLPASREGFRKLVEAQDLTTDAGRTAFAALMDTATAFDQVTAGVKAMTDAIFDEVRRIRGELAGPGQQGFAYAQAQFAIGNAQAQAGDAAALKLLPELSRNMLTLAEGSATSLIELRRIQAGAASALTATGIALGGVPSFDVGTDFVPRDMLAMVHKGERITPASQNTGNVELGDLVRALIQEVAALRSTAAETAKNTWKAADVLVRSQNTEGDALSTRALT